MPVHVSRTETGVVTLRLDNPGRRNALDAAGALRLVEELARLRDDREARCAVVTGTGSSFCSGADLGAFQTEVPPGVLARRELLLGYYRAFLDLRGLPMPTVAAVNGPAVGAGLNLALCCDLRLACESARFGATFVRLGIHPGGGATWLLSRLIGPGRAAEMVLTGEMLDAGAAVGAGLVSRVVPDAELAGAAARLAERIAANAPAVVRMAKRALRIAETADLEAVVEAEALAQAASQETDDAAEGWAAFREKRAPRFTGR